MDEALEYMATELAPAEAPQWLNLPQQWPAQGDLLSWCQSLSPGIATLLLFFGAIYLIFGWTAFKFLVMLNAAVVGAMVGFLIGSRTDAAGPAAGIGALTAAAIAWPLMKYAVALLGGVMGAVLGASIWRASGQDPAMAWSGAVMGMIALGLLSFILFRGSVMMFMCLQGSIMLVVGLLGLVYKHEQIAPSLTQALSMQPYLLPAAVLIPALIGLVYQHAHYVEQEQAKKKSASK